MKRSSVTIDSGDWPSQKCLKIDDFHSVGNALPISGADGSVKIEPVRKSPSPISGAGENVNLRGDESQTIKLLSADEIAKLCLDKFDALPSRGKPGPGEWTTLAGIVVQDGNHGRVISLATGSKSLGAKFYSPDLVSDSHAEGALLSRLIQGPVRISSVTVGGGNAFDESATTRALLRPGPEHCVLLLKTELDFAASRCSETRPCPTALLWTEAFPSEVEVCVDGRKQGSTLKRPIPLSISKRRLFRNFIDVSGLALPASYLEEKQAASSYREASQQFKDIRGWPAKAPIDFIEENFKSL